MTADTNLNAPLTRTVTFDQAVALHTHLDSLDSDAYPMPDDLLGGLLAVTGRKRLSVQVTNAVVGALECALWLGSTVVWADDEAESESCDLRDRRDEVPAEALEALTDDVQQFLVGSADLLEQAIPLYSRLADLGHSVGEQIGHDFMLTRNGHGAGFWDRGLGDLGDLLTANCKPFGSWGLEADDDQIYLTG